MFSMRFQLIRHRIFQKSHFGDTGYEAHSTQPKSDGTSLINELGSQLTDYATSISQRPMSELSSVLVSISSSLDTTCLFLAFLRPLPWRSCKQYNTVMLALLIVN